MEASWYGPRFEGNLTANGEVFDPSGYAAAYKTYAFDTKLIVTYEGRSVVVRINDRGPYVAGRELDLAQGSAEYIGLTSVGVDVVDVVVADPSTPVGPYASGSSGARNALAREPAPVESAVAATPEPSGEPSAEPDQGEPVRPQGNDNAATGNSGPAVEDQYASEDQYVAANQGQQVTEVEPAPPAPEPTPPEPKPAAPVLPPEPEPKALISPPAELAVPNSTIQKRVEFKVAAPPTPQPVEEEIVEPAPKPAPEPVEEEVAHSAPEPSSASEPVEEEVVAEPEPEPVKEVAEPEPAEEKAPEPSPEKQKEPEEVEEVEEPTEKPSEELAVLPDTGGAPLPVPTAGVLLIALGVSIRILRR